MINEIKNITRGLSDKELSNVSDYEEYKKMLLSLADLKKNDPKGFNEIKNEVLKRKQKKEETLRGNSVMALLDTQNKIIKASGATGVVELEEETKRKLERVCNG